MELTEIDALRACARMVNTLDESHMEPLLDKKFITHRSGGLGESLPGWNSSALCRNRLKP